MLDQEQLDHYIGLLKIEKQNLSTIPDETIYELMDALRAPAEERAKYAALL